MGRALRAATALIVVVLGLAGAARADAAKPTAVVSMGDSYISGEAGRWQGNSATGLPLTAFDGTDRGRAIYGTTDSSDSNGDKCHRSDVAEVVSAKIPVDKAINIACSGAKTSDLLTTSEGGTKDYGEAPQGDQLKPIAESNDVRAIVVSVGGNDLGFASIVAACLTATPANPCKASQQPKLTAGLPAAEKKVEGVIDSIRKVMRSAGYADGGYRLILQSYPSVAARAAENRFATDKGPDRIAAGCPFTNVDSDWARDDASVQIGKVVGDAARAKGAEFLDVGDLFQGHEVCAKSSQQATAVSKPSPAQSEWGRPVGATFIGQGSPNGTQESFHPNAYGQAALGACFGAAYAAKPGNFSCASAAGRAPKDVIFKRATTPVPTPSTPAQTPTTSVKKQRLRLAVHRLRPKHRGRRVCVRFVARSAGKRVKGARVTYRGRTKRTGRRGRATICDRYAFGKRTHFASVRKRGYRKAKRSFAFRVRPKRA